jgi:signal transduction histidine kinase
MPEVPDALKTAIGTLATAMQDLRSLSKVLNKEWLERFDLLENLRVESDRINLSNTISVTIDAIGTSLPLTPEAQIMLFRIIQEALHNGIRHAEATRVGITIGWEGPRILILVRDNGKGFNLDTARSNGVGFINMKHRTRMLDGTITWEPVPTGGTTVKICIPPKTQRR